MNLPDNAIEFLGNFRGSFNSISSELNFSNIYSEMPMIHCYCFTREVDRGLAEKDIRSVSVHCLLFAALHNTIIFPARRAQPWYLRREARFSLCEISRPQQRHVLRIFSTSGVDSNTKLNQVNRDVMVRGAFACKTCARLNSARLSSSRTFPLDA
jgi:hypothetical protein